MAHGMHGAVSADSTTCSQVGVDLLKRDGSAVDAIVGAALCQGIVYPFASGIGGGGFLVVKRLQDDEAVFIDFRETAPARATPLMYQNASSVFGGMAVAVPGELRGLEEAHRRYGKLPWRDVVAPAIRLARDGHVTTAQLAWRLDKNKQIIATTDRLREAYTVRGALAKEGQTIRSPKLAATLQAVAERGADAFYRGAIARQIASTVQAGGGILTTQDLAGYRPTVSRALKGTVFNRTMHYSQPPSSGAVTFHILKLMEGMSPEFTPHYAHRLVEAFKLAYAGRSLLGDPAFTDVAREVAFLTDPANVAAQLGLLSDSQTFEPTHYFANIAPALNTDTRGTSHISAVDVHGLAVSLTTTINLEFGSKLLCKATGVLLNNEMDDFSTPAAPNFFGLAPSKSNFIAPGKRPFSSMTPLILQGKEDFFVTGGSGGSRITTSVAQTILNLLQLNRTLVDAVSLGRLHHQLVPNEIRIESAGFTPSLVDALRARNHSFFAVTLPDSTVNSVYATRHSSTWHLQAVTDARKNGTAAAY